MRYGYFDNVNREYVIERPDIPVSWTNYLGVKDLCTVISHNAGTTLSINHHSTAGLHASDPMPFQWTGRVIMSI